MYVAARSHCSSGRGSNGPQRADLKKSFARQEDLRLFGNLLAVELTSRHPCSLRESRQGFGRAFLHRNPEPRVSKLIPTSPTRCGEAALR